jgi:hypothetical protein
MSAPILNSMMSDAGITGCPVSALGFLMLR